MPPSLTENLDDLFTSTWQIMRGTVADNIFDATPFWFWLNSEGRIQSESGGRWIGLPVMYGQNSNVTSIGRGGIVPMDFDEILTTARFEWKMIVGSIVRLFDDDTKNVSDNQIVNYIQTKIKNLELTMVDTLETQAHGDGTGNGGRDIGGLGYLVPTDPTTGTVAGIDVSTYTWWQSQQNSYSGTTLTDLLANMRTAYNDVSIGNDHPDLIMTSQADFEAYEATLVNILQVTTNKFGDAGFEALKYKGAAITFAPSIAQGSMFFLNGRYIKFIYNTAANWEMTEWKVIPNQLDRVAQIVLEGNLVSDNRRMQMKLTGIPTS